MAEIGSVVSFRDVALRPFKLNSNHGCVVAAMLNEVGNFPCVPRSGKSPSTFGGLRGALLVKKVAFLNQWSGAARG